MRSFFFGALALAALLGLSACASNGTGNNSTSTGDKNASNPRLQQSLRLDVLDASGKAINGLACRLANEHGYVLAQSGGTVQVKRSARDLEVDCDAPAGLSTKAQLRARADGSAAAATAPNNKGSSTSVFGSVGLGSFGSHGGLGVNIGFPIPIGTASDPAPAASNTLWRYPDWVQLRQGKTLMFDAQGSSSAQPALGYEAVRP